MTPVERAPLAAGIHTIGEARYHADPCADPSLSNSIVKLLMAKTPRHAMLAHPRLNAEAEHEDNPKFDFGRAAHALLLEGRDICVVVDAPDWRTKAAQAARDEARAAGLAPMLPHQYETLDSMVKAAWSFLAAAGLADVIGAGKPEQTVVWRDQGLGGEIWCRARADWLTNDRQLILDFKTTDVLNPGKWMKGMLELGYDTQAAFYTRGLRKLGFERARFLFLVQETSSPHCCYLVELAESMRHLAELQVERAINLWARCTGTGRWPGYSTDVHAAEAPPWALRSAGIEVQA